MRRVFSELISGGATRFCASHIGCATYVSLLGRCRSMCLAFGTQFYRDDKRCHSEPRRRRGTSHLQVAPTHVRKRALQLRGASARFASLRMTTPGASVNFIAKE